MRDLTVVLENVPGKLADLGETLGRNGINMEGICGFPLKDEAFIHILIEDETKTRSILEQAGFKVSAVREVLVLAGKPGTDILGKPGTGGDIARKIGNAGVNIDLIYFAGLNRLVIGVDNLEKAKAALEWKSKLIFNFYFLYNFQDPFLNHSYTNFYSNNPICMPPADKKNAFWGKKDEGL